MTRGRLHPATVFHRYRRRFGSRRTLGADLKAGVVLGMESVPDGLAAGLLAGVNPLHGLYAYIAGTLGGALATGSVFMTVQATGAMSVIISDVPEVHDAERAAGALAMLALLTGLIMLVLGLARLGRLTRFIPTAVLVGFINAVAVNIVLGQLDNITGIHSEGDNRLLRALDSVLHLTEYHLPSLLVAAVTIATIVLLERTRVGALGMVVGVVAASALTVLFPGVATLGDSVEVQRSLPLPALPDLALLPTLVVPALALALVGLVQGAAISTSVPNPNGRYADASADFRGQGVANLLTGVFQGMPVGGSMSATSLVRAAGARSALANLVAAIVMCLVVLLLGPLIGATAMPALGALLLLIGIRMIKPGTLWMIWRTGPMQASVLAVTFLLTILIPLQFAVLTGVGLAVILHVARQSNRVRLTSWVFDDDSPLPREETPPAELPAHSTTILVPYGSLFFAAAPVLEAQLPRVGADSRDAVVILRLRGTDEVGATFINVVRGYSDELRARGGVLLLAGISPHVHQQLLATGAAEQIGLANIHPARDRLGSALSDARRAADEHHHP